MEGAWWDDTPATPEIARRVDEGAVRISLDEELAGELGAGLGSVLDWNVQGRPIRSVVASTREVDWSRFQPNFFVIFEPGALEGAPTTWIGLAPLAEESVRLGLQQSLLSNFPNVSFIDLSTVRETVIRISTQVTRLLGGMSLFALAGGYLVVLATLLTGRFRRRAESALIRTLGGTSRTVRHSLLVEYTLLGAIGGAAGIVLGAGAGLALLRWGFDLPSSLPHAHLAGIWAGLMGLTLLSGWSVSGPILRDSPLAILP
jgi:putative ABC transport system permease protein